MSGVYTVDDETSLFIYARDSQIYLRYKNGPYFGNPILLAKDYAQDLMEVESSNMIYLAYHSLSDSILVKDLHGKTIFEKPCKRLANANFDFVFTSFNHKPLLIYPSENDSSYALSYTYPLFPGESYPLRIGIKSPNTLYPIISFESLFLLISDDKETALYRMQSSPDSPCICLLGPEKELAETIQKDTLQKELLQKASLEKELFHTKEMLESAISQYNELMDVAQKYKDEAEKWRSKFWR